MTHFVTHSPEGYAAIPNSLARDPDVPVAVKMVYVLLSGYAGAKAGSWPSHARLAGDIGVSVNTVKRALAWLRANGYVTWTGRTREDGGQTSNAYTIMAPPGHDRPTP